MRKIFLILVLLGMGAFNCYALDNNDNVTDAPYDSNAQVVHPVLFYDTATGEYSVPHVTSGGQLVYLTVALPEGTNNIGKVNVADVIASSATNKTTVYQGETVIIGDERYKGKISTGTANKVTGTGTITANFDVIDWSFYADGGDVQITTDFTSGIIYVLNGISVDGICKSPYNNPTITISSLDSGATLYYVITGTN